MATRTPSPLPETGVRGDIARAVNQLTEEVRRQKLVARPGQKVSTSTNGTTLDPGISQAATEYGDKYFY